jgi:hypothetical protein
VEVEEELKLPDFHSIASILFSNSNVLMV